MKGSGAPNDPFDGPEGNRKSRTLIKDKVKRPVRTAEFPANVMSHISMRTDQKPFSDVRVRHAMSLALDRQSIIDSFEPIRDLVPSSEY